MVSAAPVRTLEDTIAWEVARLGQHRPEGEWSAGANVNDCALFQSDALGYPRLVWNTEVFKTLGGGTYHRGKAGLQRGDVVLFDWNYSGLSDHVEMALGAPDGAGNFQTVGANSSARPDHGVAYNVRNGYVLGYWRPSYPRAAVTPVTPAAPAATTNRTDTSEEDITIMAGYPYIVRGDENDAVSIVRSPSEYSNVASADWNDPTRKAAIERLYGPVQTIGIETVKALRAGMTKQGEV